jgi:hypothetical protein
MQAVLYFAIGTSRGIEESTRPIARRLNNTQYNSPTGFGKHVQKKTDKFEPDFVPVNIACRRKRRYINARTAFGSLFDS